MTTIEEILYEAHAYGLRREVLDRALLLLTQTKFYNIIDAYQLAYNQIITTQEEFIER